MIETGIVYGASNHILFVLQSVAQQLFEEDVSPKSIPINLTITTLPETASHRLEEQNIILNETGDGNILGKVK
jgi:hypothetical protein